MCRMCCQLFVSDRKTVAGVSEDQRIAAFRPCGHVFHYSCIMDRYQRMEDNCTCVTCFKKYVVISAPAPPTLRFEDLPVILFMEWSKSARQVSREETEEIEIVTAPDPHSIELREQLEMLKLKLGSLSERKDQLIRQLNDINDATAIARARCEGLDDICEQLVDRLQTTRDALSRETRSCQELVARIKRDQNRAVLGGLTELLDELAPESKICEYLFVELGKTGDSDDLLTRLAAFYAHHHKQVKVASAAVAQLRTVVHSARKDSEHAVQRLHAAERATLVKKVVASTAKAPPVVVDRKTVPMKPVPVKHSAAAFDDDLAPPRKRNAGFANIFN